MVVGCLVIGHWSLAKGFKHKNAPAVLPEHFGLFLMADG